MSLAPGTRLGSYEVLAPLGAGGMGEVYRARDARLDREVAVKVLPEAVARDADALARFTREAKAVAALSHPNILAIFELGNENGTAYAVTELLEGETLRERLSGGPLSPRKAIDFAIQLAQGLAAAHEKGIVHRDLKPENIFVTVEGRVKILDFGLAKQREARELPNSVALTTPVSTEPGTVLGTVGYMAPEQVKGLAADHRADIFAFGCVLYEMLAGRRAFQRDTAVETMTAILKEEPPELPPSVSGAPAGLQTIVRDCLEKAPAERIQSVRDIVLWLRAHADASSGSMAAPKGRASTRRGRELIIAAAMLLAGLALGRLLGTSRAARSLPSIRAVTFSGSDAAPAVAPDGKSIAFSSSRDGKPRIWIKQLASGGEAAVTAGPDGLPRFSPDGSQLLFVRAEGAHTALYRQALVGGEPRRVLDDVVSADFAPDGKSIVFVRYVPVAREALSVLFVMGVDGGALHEIARTSGGLNHPRFSPDARTIVASQVVQGGAPNSIFVVGADGTKPHFVSTGGVGSISSTAFVANDEVLYSRALSAAGSVTGSEATILRQRLDTPRGIPVLWSPHNSRVLDILGPGRAVFDTSSPRENLREFALDSGASAPRWLTHGGSNDRQPVYSPDGEWVLFSSNRAGNLDLWELSPKSGAIRRVTDDAAEDWDPAFTPDGTKILWSSNRGGTYEVWIAERDGSGARQLTHDGVDAENPTATADGWVVYTSSHADKRGLWKVRFDGSQASRLVTSAFVLTPQISHDGRYIAYVRGNPTSRNSLEIVRLADGAATGFEIEVAPITAASYGVTGVLGRARWLPEDRAVAFLGQDEDGINGIYVQDFVPGQDTARTRRRLAAFDSDIVTESFGLSPDGRRMTVASYDRVFSIMLAENLEGISPPNRASR